MAASRWALLGRHLTVEASLFWYSVVPVAACLFVPRIWCDWPESFKYAGLFLQILGLVTVGYALGETLSSFKKASVTARVIVWFRDLKRYILNAPPEPPKVVQLHSAGSIGLAGRAWAQVTNASTTLEERVIQLAKDLERVRARVEEIDRNATEGIQETRRMLDREIQALKQSDAEIRSALEMEAVGDWDREVMGLVWLAFGTIFAGIPEELTRLVS